MTAATNYPHIQIDDAGTARLGRSRYKVLHLAGEHYHYGWTAEELLRQHPTSGPRRFTRRSHSSTIISMKWSHAFRHRTMHLPPCGLRLRWRVTNCGAARELARWHSHTTWTCISRRRSPWGSGAAVSTC